MNRRVEMPGSVTTDRLAGLITLQKRLMSAKGRKEAEYVLVNDTGYLFPARQILLVANGKLSAHSGATDVEQQSPYLHWVRRVLKTFELDRRDVSRRVDDASASSPDQLMLLTPERLAERDAALGADWSEYWPREGVWIPMVWRGRLEGGLLLLREKPWNEAEQRLLTHWVQGAEHVLARHAGRKRSPVGKRLLTGAIVVMLGLLMLIPVRLSVLGQAEIVPQVSSLIRSPLDGVLKELAVAPNDPVEKGQLLARLDDAELKGRLAEARQALAVAQAEYARARQRAFTDRDASAEVPLLLARVEQTRADVDFLEQQLTRVRVEAPRAGVAIIGDVSDWAGRPVQLGERLLEVADTRGAEVEIWLPSADNIPLPEGAKVSLFLNVDPSQVRDASLTHVNYRAELAPDGELAYRARALLNDAENLPRVGWRGTAKVEGEQVTLGYYLFRRPWATLRSWIGW
ncbi:efflux RND transporter periplasmic adaptor subunit [Cobetia marina]|uniref:efflux RND transporter periplasmic adaptor subunit n=1 Tax=Cobetia marina TaxID=28258 RepID=UPI0025485B1D|nr:HlyD family efflux transporter periplasmic adaptor subunit [Cobetia pacifica]MDI6003733.1 HlyD family efflux transporter periplasmic adaptor subunit [Cobetia pacifica]